MCRNHWQGACTPWALRTLAFPGIPVELRVLSDATKENKAGGSQIEVQSHTQSLSLFFPGGLGFQSILETVPPPWEGAEEKGSGSSTVAYMNAKKKKKKTTHAISMNAARPDSAATVRVGVPRCGRSSARRLGSTQQGGSPVPLRAERPRRRLELLS